MGNYLSQSRKAIFLNNVSLLSDRKDITDAPSNQPRSRILDSLLAYQREAILNNSVSSEGVDLFSIVNLDMSSQYMYGINFDLIGEIKNIKAKSTKFHPPDPRKNHLASVFGHSKIIDSNLDKADFSFCPIDCLFFAKSSLEKTVFDQVQFESGAFREVKMKWASFKNASLTSVSFSGSDLQGVNFKGARIFGDSPGTINRRMRQVFSEDSYIGGTIFDEADLYLLSFEGQSLRNVSFKNSSLRDTEFYHSTFQNVNFCGARLRNVLINSIIPVYLEMPRIVAEKLTLVGGHFSINFEDAIVKDSDFLEVDFQASNFKGALFNNVIFSGSNMLSVKNIDKARFVNCKMDGAIFPT